jgi:hypothetical protein
MAEMAGALVRARQSLNPVVYLETFRDLLKKHQTGNRTLLESLLSSLGEDFFLPLAEQVPEGDEAETARFASVYTEVGVLVRALAPGSPLAKRREAEQQVLEGVFREISRRNQSEEAEKKKVVEEHYEKLLEARRRDVRSQPEVKSLVTRAIDFAIFGVFAIIFGVIAIASYSPSGSQREEFGIAEFVVLVAEFGVLALGIGGAIVEFARPVGAVILGVVGAEIFVFLGLLIGLGAFVIAGVYFFRFRRRMRTVQLTAEESAAHQQSIKNIEDYFRQKEELERAQAVVAVAKG